MLFCKCSSFLDFSGGDYNLMGNIFAQFPISHMFSFTFCVTVILFFSLFFFLLLFLAWGNIWQVFFLLLFIIFISLFIQSAMRNSAGSEMENVTCIDLETVTWLDQAVERVRVCANNMHVYAEWMCKCRHFWCDCWFLFWRCEKEGPQLNDCDYCGNGHDFIVMYLACWQAMTDLDL